MKLSHIILITPCVADVSLFAQKSELNRPPCPVASTFNWQGTYFGITNCANCVGIETKLILHEGNKYILTTKLANSSEEVHIEKGTFKWKDCIIILEGITVPQMAGMYKVEKNQVMQLYLIDGKIWGENSTGYILKKQ